MLLASISASAFEVLFNTQFSYAVNSFAVNPSAVNSMALTDLLNTYNKIVTVRNRFLRTGLFLRFMFTHKSVKDRVVKA